MKEKIKQGLEKTGMAIKRVEALAVLFVSLIFGMVAFWITGLIFGSHEIGLFIGIVFFFIAIPLSAIYLHETLPPYYSSKK